MSDYKEKLKRALKKQRESNIKRDPYAQVMEMNGWKEVKPVSLTALLAKSE